MIFNMVGGAGGGKDGAAILTVQAPINTDVTVSKDTKSYTKNSGSSGTVTFRGLTTGDWAVSISNELQTQTRTVTITTTYSVVIAFFAATINITYPAGSTCIVKKDNITLTAPDTSGTWDCVVPSTGVWNVYCTDGELTVDQDVTITADGETQSLNLAYFTATIAVTYPAGSTCSTTMGDITLNAPDTSGTWTCIVHYAGNWVFTCTDGTQTTTNTVTISTDGESKSLVLAYQLIFFDTNTTSIGYTACQNNNNTFIPFFQAGTGFVVDAVAVAGWCWAGTSWIIFDLADLSMYNTLIVNLSASSGSGSRKLFITSTKTTFLERCEMATFSNVIASIDLNVGRNTLNISNISSGYVILAATTPNTSGAHTYLTANNLWAENL